MKPSSKKTGDIGHTCQNRRSDILPPWKMIYALHRRITGNWPHDARRLPATVPSLLWPKHLGRLRWII
jgi:hypothetical protein